MNVSYPDRIIDYRAGQVGGPLLIVLSQIHGNEPAGTAALQALFRAMDDEYSRNPDFNFSGQIVGLIGNVQAALVRQRYIQRDLNRAWRQEDVEYIMQQPLDQLQAEALEVRQLLTVIHEIINYYQPQKLVFLDLHTTTAKKGVFTIPAPDDESRRIALNMHVPVVHGFLDGLAGTSLHYFNARNFIPNTTTVCFEAGQHEERDAYLNAISAIINCFRSIGGFEAAHIELRHDELLQRFAKGLPRETKLVYTHKIRPEDNFAMRPGYYNFAPVQQGEIVADDVHGPIRATHTGFMLMPLYQKQGEDGFFIVQPLADNRTTDFIQTHQTTYKPIVD